MECAPSNNNSSASILQKQGEHIVVLEKTNRELAQSILELQSLLATSQSRIFELEVKITELEARLGLHSGNSSFPPSRDIGPHQKHPKPASLRKKSGKKAGGQKNVKG
jgi:hypothetical protein